MANTFHLTVARVGENLFDGEAHSVSLPGEEGVFVVLPHHEAFVTPLKAGEAKVEAADGTSHTFAIEKGIAEISNNQATVLL
jgi:F-type H+-transporting ATPase subunit epsilon